MIYKWLAFIAHLTCKNDLEQFLKDLEHKF